MATVAAPTRTKFDARVQGELDKAVGRIRANDLLTGGLAVGVLLLGFTAGMVILDAQFGLAMWARQLALGGFLLALGGVGWLYLVRPLRRAVNPRFAARRVEETVAGSKNAVINWVDLQERDLPATVKAAVGQSAAGNLQNADVAKATEARPVFWLGCAAGLLGATLAVLFIALKPAPFVSLVKRTFNPFVDRAIATRTTLTLTEPAAGDAVVTAGESLTVAVDVGGSVPPSDGPRRLRVQVWYADGAEPDEIPLEAGPDRDWRTNLPPSVVQNGFQYRVVGGDARTADHRVTVRTRPLVTGFEAKYEAPAYTRIPVETAREPKLEGYRGTKVTLTARTNRPLKRGYMLLEGTPEPIAASIDGEAMRFELTLQQSGSYRLGFTSATDEVAEQTPPYPVRVLTDAAPTLTINKPAEEEVTLPANGVLAIDGEAADDFGLATVTLRMQAVAPFKLPLQPKPYRGGKEFKRADGTYPTRLTDAEGSQTGYRETVKLSELKTESGQPLPKADDLVIEYWLEATDTCTEPRPNVGKSAVKRVRLAPKVEEPQKQAEQKKQAEQRQADQQKHEQAQDKQLEGEKRPNKQVRPDPDQPKPEDGGEKSQEPQQGSEPKKNADPQQGTESKEGSEPKKGSESKQGSEPKQASEPKKSNEPQQGTEPQGGNESQPKTDQPQKGGTGQTQKGGKPQPSPDDKKLDEQARKMQDAIKEQGGGSEPAPKPSAADRDAEKKRQQETQQAIDDLNGSDPQKQEDARKKLDETVGPEQRKRIEKIQQGLKSDDPKQREEARKEMGELDRETGASSAGIRGDRKEDVERLSRELNSDDKGTRENAERQADEKFGPEGKDELKKAGEKLNSPQKPKQDEGKKDVDELMKKDKKKKEQPAGGDGKPSPEQVKEMAEAAKDLNSSDTGKKAAAEKKLDEKMGPEARKQLQQDLKDLQSGDADKKQAAEQKLKDAAEKMAGGKPTEQELKQAADAAKDLNSPDADKKAAAEKKLDQQIGPDARKELQKQMKDKADADAARQAGQAADDKAAKDGKPQPTPEQKQELEQAAKDLNSPDPAKKAAAEKKLDEAIGPKEREKLQQQQADPQGAKQAAEKAVEDAKKMKELADAAKDLNSKDKDKQQAAEKKLDQQMGPEARQKLQQELTDLQSEDPKTREAAQQRLKQALDKLPKTGPGGGGGDPDGEAYKDDLRNRLRAAELQLKTFEKNRDNKAAMEKAGFTQEEFDRLTAEIRKRVEQLKVEVAKPRPGPADKPAAGSPTLTIGGAGKVEKKDGGPTTGGANTGKATPGFTDAQRKFSIQAAKGAPKPAEPAKQP